MKSRPRKYQVLHITAATFPPIRPVPGERVRTTSLAQRILALEAATLRGIIVDLITLNLQRRTVPHPEN
jgi:hypothetical protein